MADQCGSRPRDDVLGDILYPSMDPSSISELVHYRIEVGHGPDMVTRAVDPSNYLELREYVQTRDARERALAPVPTRKMEVGSFAEQHQHHHHQHELQQEIPFPGVEPSWGEDWTMVGYCNDQDNSLSAFGKGGKGKGGDYVKRPLDCHNCGGLGHPSRLCTSRLRGSNLLKLQLQWSRP